MPVAICSTKRIMVALLVRHRRTSRVDADLSSWSITSGARPIAAALRALPEVRITRAITGVAVIAAALLVPVIASPSQLDQASIWLIYGLVAVSLVVLKKNLAPALAIFGDVVARPRFDDKEWKRVSALWKNDLQKRAQDPGSVSRVAMSSS